MTRSHPVRAPRHEVLAVVLVAALGPACASDVLREDGDDDAAAGARPAALACDGDLGAEPTVLATGLDATALHLAGDDLVLAAPSGRVSRVDRCGGAVEVLAELGSGVHVGLVDADAALVTVESPPRLATVPLAGGEPRFLADLPGPGRVAALPIGPFFGVVAIDDAAVGDADGNDDVAVVSIDGGTGLVTFVRQEELWLPGTWTLLGASEAGLVVRNGSYHGGNPGLLRVPPDGGPVTELPGTHGAVDVAVVGDRLLVAGEPEENGMGSGRMEIARMTTAGDDREVVVPDSDAVGYVRRIAADRRLVCWAGDAVRCAANAPGAEVETVATIDEGWIEDLVVAPDAVYWLHHRDQAGLDEGALVAVAR